MKKSRSGVSRQNTATEKANKGKTGYRIAQSRAETINTYSKNLPGTSSSESPRKKSRAKARAAVSNRPKRGFAG